MIVTVTWFTIVLLYVKKQEEEEVPMMGLMKSVAASKRR